MITEDERFIKIQGILALSDIHPVDCIKINDLIIDLSKQKQHLQNIIDKAIKYLKEKEDSLFMTFDDDLLSHDELIDKKIGLTLLEILKGGNE